jgi:hypothetical protein
MCGAYNSRLYRAGDADYLHVTLSSIAAQVGNDEMMMAVMVMAMAMVMPLSSLQ